ncbi:MAG: PD40 domain-containing protein [Flavobacteriales bacterium]|nr:PD40 domain-containing protein [Flavobacteriales bacterium]
MKHGYAAFLAFGLALCSTPANAQGENTSFNWKFEEASKLMEEKLFNQAAELWTELVTSQPENANLNWKLGSSYMSSYNQKGKALPYLQKASDLRTDKYGGFNSAGYDPFDPNEKNAPVEVDYWLGRAYHLNGQFDKADQYYDKFLVETESKHNLSGLAKRGKEQTANARQHGTSPKPYQVSNVGKVINSEYPDFSPVVSVDGNAIFFTSRRVRPDSSNSGVIDDVAGMAYEDIYVSYKDRNGVWQTPELLNVSAQGHEATVNVSADGQTLYIFRDDNGDGNLYESKLVGELWSDPVLIGSDVNTKSWETHCALTADGSTLYFISDRKGGQGGRDIYRVVKLPNGEWSKAQNIGPVLNTPYDEDGVFIHPNGRTMYFSSTGHNSMGGFDIFMTEMDEAGNWSKPENLGVPINTVDDDAFFVTTADGRRGYFSSDQISGYGEKDIYFVDLPESMEADGLTVLKGFIIPPPGETLPPSTILYVTDKATGEVKAYKPRQRDGVYVAILPPCKEYNLDYRVNDVTVHTEDIFVECESTYQEINKEIYLNPVSLAGPASIVDLPKGAPPGGKEKGDPVKGKGAPGAAGALTDAQLKDKASKHVAPDATYDAEYAKYYAYNMKDIDQNDAEWVAFIDKVVGLIDRNGEARVVIDASASKVPTRTYGTNENLSQKRMEDARRRLLEAVAARGKDNTKLMLEAVNSKVLGPKYDGDFKNTEKYGKYQYVKLKVH